MSVRVVARIRPLLKLEIEKDTIVSAAASGNGSSGSPTVVRIPNPKNEAETFSFQFQSVYDQEGTQAEIFENEVAPTVKQLFKGYDITLFAYGVTGTGKTHTMRGGKSLAERGVIPRMLSSIYRRSRRVAKESAGETQVDVAMSYYEIYNDRVYDLFEPLEKRTPAGLPLRDNNGKTIVVGLTEKPCTTLKDFEQLYDQANVNRSTSATKLNAQSSRSHAILCVKVTQATGDHTQISTASAIDLAGSEDNRRTDNGKERLVESAAINRSLFVLAQCVEAISRKQVRVPYRESKMTRILSLGQQNAVTVMILNLAPVRSYHLDTLSSLNFANRTKKIEINEAENVPFFREAPGKRTDEEVVKSSLSGPILHRQPLRPKMLSQNAHLEDVPANIPKPAKQFSVYTDKSRASQRSSHLPSTTNTKSSGVPLKSAKRTSSEEIPAPGRAMKTLKPNELSRPTNQAEAGMSIDAIEALIERKVNEALAERADATTVSESAPAISDEVQARLAALEQRVKGQETERAEGLQYLLMAKQHQVRGEDASALKMYQLALPHFPGNEKLARKLVALQDRVHQKKQGKRISGMGGVPIPSQPHSSRVEEQEDDEPQRPTARRKLKAENSDDDFQPPQTEQEVYNEGDSMAQHRPRTKIRQPKTRPNHAISRSTTTPSLTPVKHTQHSDSDSEDELATALVAQTPRTKHLLNIINTRDVGQIKLLKGVGAKKAEAIVNCLCDMEDEGPVTDLMQLGKLRGVGVKTVQNMREGIAV